MVDKIKQKLSLTVLVFTLLMSSTSVLATGDAGTLALEDDFIASQPQFVENLKKSAYSDVANAPGTYTYEISIDGAKYLVNKSTYDLVDKKVKSYESATKGNVSGSVDSAKQQVQGMTQNLNLGADTTTASLMLSGLEPFITTVLGICVWVLTAGLTIFTVFDLLYIYFPIFREKSAEVASKGNAITSKTTADGGSKYRFITDEAIYAVQSCGIETGKHPVTVWLPKRVGAYILVAIALYLMLTGNITLIVNIALNMVGGVIETLKGFGV